MVDNSNCSHSYLPLHTKHLSIPLDSHINSRGQYSVFTYSDYRFQTSITIEDEIIPQLRCWKGLQLHGHMTSESLYILNFEFYSATRLITSAEMT